MNPNSLHICNCEGTIPLDGGLLRDVLDVTVIVHPRLCRSSDEDRRSADALVFCQGCAAPGPEEEKAVTPQSLFPNLLECAAWSDDAASSGPKVAALIAAARMTAPAHRTLTIHSAGHALVYGRGDETIDAALQLAERVPVTCLLTAPTDAIPRSLSGVELCQGRITSLRGHVGAFEVSIADCGEALPSSRARYGFAPSRDVTAVFDMVLDLSGDPPMLSGSGQRAGYLRADPQHPAAVQRALFEAADLVGDFDKPVYVSYEAALCAHARNGINGCTRCLDLCPASAIQPDGDHVTIDDAICEGCGSCAAACPTGAVRYDFPGDQVTAARLATMLDTYRRAGGRSPVILFHDGDFGAEAIAMAARFARGLPARVLPVPVHQVSQIGLDLLLAAASWGADRVLILYGRRNESTLEGLQRQIADADAVLAGLGYGAGRIATLEADDPEAVADALYALPASAPVPAGRHIPQGGHRSLTELALAHLRRHAPSPTDEIALSDGAAYGTLDIDAEDCTLCLACVSVCPTGALGDSPDRPMLTFTEAACVQCGLCRATCPESVLRLVPRLNLARSAREPVVLKTEEPACCTECGKPFGTAATLERMLAKLADHPMFAGNPRALERLRMCEICRVAAMLSEEGAPAARGGASR